MTDELQDSDTKLGLSRYQKSKYILGIEQPSPEIDKELSPARRQWEQEELQPLNLPARRRSRRLALHTIVGAAAGVAVILFVSGVLFSKLLGPGEDPTGLRVKGPVNIRLYYKRGTQVTVFDGRSLLKSGDRILGEVSSHKPMFAYWTIADRNGRLLTGLDHIRRTRITTGPKAPTSFTESFELTEPNDGEHVVVIACARDARLKDGEIKRLVSDHLRRPVKSQKSMGEAGCTGFPFRLR